MTTSSINSNVDTPTPNYQSSFSSTLGEVDYMLLLATELQYQDPTDPMDTEKITEQTCMFAQLDAVQSISDQLAGLEEAMTNRVDPVSYLGRNVEVSGNTLTMEDGESSDMTMYLGEDAESVYVDIYDSVGNIVATEDLGAIEAGSMEIEWDGELLTGETASDGNYTVEIRAVDANGKDVGATTTINDTVVSVTNGSDGALFTLKNGTVVKYTDIFSVGLGEEDA